MDGYMSDILIYIERNTGKHTDKKKDKQTDKKNKPTHKRRQNPGDMKIEKRETDNTVAEQRDTDKHRERENEYKQKFRWR